MIRILAIDGASVAGFALGATGEEPRFGTRNFSGSNATGEVVARFSRFLRAQIEHDKLDVIAYEAPYVPQSWRTGPALNAKTVRRLFGLAEIIDAICWDYKVRCYQATPGEVCRYLTGKANWGGRAQKKTATIAAARAWGWPVEDDNQADALAVWSYAESILDPIAAARRRAGLGLELALDPPNGDAPRGSVAGRRGSSNRQGKTVRGSPGRHKIGGTHGKQRDNSFSDELQFPVA